MWRAYTVRGTPDRHQVDWGGVDRGMGNRAYVVTSTVEITTALNALADLLIRVTLVVLQNVPAHSTFS